MSSLSLLTVFFQTQTHLVEQERVVLSCFSAFLKNLVAVTQRIKGAVKGCGFHDVKWVQALKLKTTAHCLTKFASDR